MKSVALDLCHQAADRAEAAAYQLGPAWPGHAPVVESSRAFRHSAESLAGNRGLAAVTVAFVGPKKAGKTSMLSLLIRAPEVRASLHSGRRATESTSQLTWIGSQRPVAFDSMHEDFIACPGESIEPFGPPVMLLDVPGFDEVHDDRAQAAKAALDSALVKVLVVARHQIEVREVFEYLGRTDGAVILPVVNFATDSEAAGDAEAFVSRLRETIPAGRILPPVLVPDYEAVDVSAEETLVAARKSLVAALRPVLAQVPPIEHAAPQLTARTRHFRKEISALAHQYLPSVSRELQGLDAALAKLAAKVLAEFLGDDRTLSVPLRGRFRAVWLERTPVVFFPWRLMLSVANLVAGATDRLALVALGSIPSLIATAWTAARNVRDTEKFAEEIRSGLRRRIAARFTEAAAPEIEPLESAFRRDLRAIEEESPSASAEMDLAGLETVQDRSSALFREAVEAHAPSRAFAWTMALVGTAIFWGVLGWPVYALYHDFAVGAAEAAAGGKIGGFPAPSFNVIATALLLAWLPMFVFLLLNVAWVTRAGQVRRAIERLRAGHQRDVQHLLQARLLGVRPVERRIRACQTLLRFDEAAGGTRA
jgi:hypothetical protein